MQSSLSRSMADARVLSDSLVRRAKDANPSPRRGASSQFAGSVGGGNGGRLASYQPRQDALRNFRGWVWSSLRPLANRIASRPVRVALVPRNVGAPRPKGMELAWEKKAVLPNGMKHLEGQWGAEVQYGHPLLDALADPNAIMTQWAVLFVTVLSLKMRGEFYWWFAPRDPGHPRSREVPWEIWPTPAAWVTPIHTDAVPFAGFVVKAPGMTDGVYVPPEQMARFYSPMYDNPLGHFAEMQTQSEAIRLGQKILAAQEAGMDNGVRPSMIIRAGKLPDITGGEPQTPHWTEAQRAQIIHLIKGYYGGAARNGEPLIIDALIDSIEKWYVSQAEMDYGNSERMNKARIVQGAGANSVVMGDVEGIQRATAIIADEVFVQGTVNPMIEMMSQCMTAWGDPLFSSTSERAILYIEPDTTYDAEMDLKRVLALFDRGGIDVDEARARLLDLPPMPGNQGKVVFVNSALKAYRVKDIDEGEDTPNPFLEVRPETQPGAPASGATPPDAPPVPPGQADGNTDGTDATGPASRPAT